MLFILDKKQTTVGVASNSNPSSLPYFGDLHNESLDGVSTYEFSVPANHPESNKITGNGHIIVRDLDGNHLLFTIKEIQESKLDGIPVKNVFCENTAIDELLTDVQRPLLLASSSLENAATTVLSSTSGWELGDVFYDGSWDYQVEDYITVLEALRKAAATFHADLYFTVELEGTKIVRKKVNFAEERGNDTGVRFDYGHNTMGVGRTEDTTGLITALVAVGQGDSEGTRLSLADVSAFDEGDISHVAGTDYLVSESAFQDWSKNGKHIFGIFIDDEATTLDHLKRNAISELTKRIIPYMIYTASVHDFSRYTGYEARKVRIGDRVTIKDTTYNPAIVISGRVRTLERSYTDKTRDKIDLGSFKPIAISVSPDIKKLQETISRNEGVWNVVGTTILKGTEEPLDVEDGQLWLNTTNNTMKKFNATTGVWDKVTRSDLSEVTGQVVSTQITDGAVTTTKVTDGAVTTVKVADYAINTSKLGDASITNAKIDRASINKLQVVSADIVDANITNAKIANLAVNSAKIQDASITNAKIGNLAVDSAKIADASITNAKIGSLAVDAAKIADASIITAKIVDGAISNAKIANASIDTAKIQNAVITNAKLDRATVDKIQIGSADIIDASILSAKIADASIGTAKIADASIITAKIADAQITTAKIGLLAVDNSKIANASIDTAKIADASITNVKIDRASVNKLQVVSADIVDASITSAKISDASITNAKIVNVDASKINAGYVSADRLQAGTITTSKLLVSDFTNLCENPDFELGTAGWSFINSSIDSTTANLGTKSAKFTGTSEIKGNVITTKPGDKFHFSCWYKASADKAGAGGLRCLNADTNEAITVDGGGYTFGASTVWFRAEGIITVPAGVKAITPRIAVAYSTGSVWVDTVELRRMSGGELIVDGAITANSAIIADGAITNAKMQDASISTAKIADASITTAKIGALSVDSTKIKDASISTAKIQTGAITTAVIANGAIGSAQIGDASITDAKIVAVSAGKMTTGTLDASKVNVTNLVADNIVTGTLTIASANLTRNGSFATGDLQFWSLSSSSAVDTVNKHKGHNVTNVTATNGSYLGTKSDYIEVLPNQEYVYSLEYKATQAHSFMEIGWFTDAKVAISNSSNYPLPITTGFQASTLKATSPSNAKYASIRYLSHSLATTGTAFTATLFQLQKGKLVTEWQPHTNELLADKGITNLQIGDSAVDNRVITANTITGDKFIADTITAREIKASTITATQMVAGTITAASGILADAVITTAKIGDGQITNAKIGSLAVDSAKIADSSITNAKIGSLAVTGAKIASATITDTQIASATITGAKIASATITDTQIANATISSAKIASLDAAKITTGTLDANRIAANSITASQMVIADFTNLCENPDFELDTVGQAPKGYVNISAGRVADISAFMNGNGSNRCLEIDARNGSNSDAYSSLLIPVTEGQQFYVEFEGRHLNTTGTGSTAVGFRRYDQKRVALSSWLQIATFGATKVSAFEKRSGSYTVPAGTGYLQIFITFANNAETTNKFYVDNIRIHRKANADLIVDGAITTAKLTANSITANEINAGTITATEIANSTITGGKIAGATITGSNLVSGTITATQIAGSTITASQIANSTITGGKIAGTTITGSNIVDATLTGAKIASATITDAQIANATISSAKIASLDAAKITAGYISSDRISAKSINSDKLSVVSPNVIASGWDSIDQLGLGKQPNGASGLLTTCVVSSDISYVGKYSLRTVNSAASSYKYVEDHLGIASAKAGERWIISAYANRPYTGIANVHITLVFRDDAGTALGSYTAGSVNVDITTGWVRAFAYGTAPAGTTKVTGYVRTNTSTAVTVYWDAFQLELVEDASQTTPSQWKPSGTSIIDGGNIITNTITATQIIAGTITATEIANSTITGAKISGATITDANIASATITSAKIASLDAAKITTGTLDADKVSIANGKVAINSTGVTVKDADFLIEDVKSSTKTSMKNLTNFIADHSFELTPHDTVLTATYYYSSTADLYRSYKEWARVGTPKIYSIYGTDASSYDVMFGNKSALVNSTNYYFQDIDVKASQVYTLSFYVSTPLATTQGTPRVSIDFLADDVSKGVVSSDFSKIVTTYGDKVRFSYTFTAPSTMSTAYYQMARIKLLSIDAYWVLIDGIQVVSGNVATYYDSEDSLHQVISGSLPVQSLQISSGGEIRSGYNDSYFIRDHGNGNVTLSAAGGDLYLGYVNTNNVRLQTFMVTANATNQIEQGNWIAPSLLNGWSNYVGTFSPLGYRKTTHGTVQLRGLVTGGSTTSNTSICQLPVGYRPPYVQMLIGKNSGSTQESNWRCNVNTDGTVQFIFGDSTQDAGYVSLDGMEFPLV